MKLQNFALGRWIDGSGEGQPLYDASTGDLVATATSNGLDFGEMLEYGRKTGNRHRRWYWKFVCQC